MNPAFAAFTGQAIGHSMNINRPRNVTMGTPLDHQRTKNLAIAYQQRRIKHLKGLVGNNAATISNRLRISQGLPILMSMLTGSLAGAGLGLLSRDKASGAAAGALIGTVVGGFGGLGLGAIGRASGSLSDSNKEQLKEELNNIGLAHYLVPGLSAELDAKLDKDFLQDEEDRPQQYII